MPPASPVPGWSSGEVCRLIIASRSSPSTRTSCTAPSGSGPPRDLNPEPSGVIPGTLQSGRVGAARAPRGGPHLGAVASPAYDDAGQAVGDHEGAERGVDVPVGVLVVEELGD